MSFDEFEQVNKLLCAVSIPFEQGDVFRRKFDLPEVSELPRLNPFRAGRCLST